MNVPHSYLTVGAIPVPREICRVCKVSAICATMSSYGHAFDCLTRMLWEKYLPHTHDCEGGIAAARNRLLNCYVHNVLRDHLECRQ